MMLRTLGKTDIEISSIGLGCWQFSEGQGVVGKYWDALSSVETREIVDACLTGGINWFDTAEAYGNGKSEAALARALKSLGKENGDVVVATKWLPLPWRTAKSIGKTIDDRLRFLDGFAIDLHQVHQPMGSRSTHKAQMRAMAELASNGKIRSVGVSNFSAKAMGQCHAFLQESNVPLAANQVRYSLLDRRIESKGVMQAAKDLGITVIAYSPLAQGLLSGKFHDDPSLIKKRSGPRRYIPAFQRSGLEKSAPVINALKEIAVRHDATPAQIALSWLVNFHGDTVVAIPGATRPSHVVGNVGAMNIALADDEMQRLDEVSRPFL